MKKVDHLSNDQVFVPKKRPGTKTYLDISIQDRVKDLRKSAGQCFLKALPREIRHDFVNAFLYAGIQSPETLRWVNFVTSANNGGKAFSETSKIIRNDPHNPKTFLFLYGERDFPTGYDRGYPLLDGSDAIFRRMQSIVDRLPEIILSERRSLLLREDEKYVIYNIGSAFSLDSIYILMENEFINRLVKFVCIDPDEESLNCGKRYAEQLGLTTDSIEFLPVKLEDVDAKNKAHMLLIIGIFCPIKTKGCVFLLKEMSKYLLPGGLAIFSTVQERMVENNPLIDFMMWGGGWTMNYKKDQEPGVIAKLAGFSHEKFSDWEDELGFNRMTVARLGNIQPQKH